ncbi:hypothetical protein GOP47_0021465 [Adiantum capillus-veneris]|uniref:Uncharacterized protein n=1 Tax=Adiantum capillus-veneris TaxID=13818 RepID=A0A9D4Z591_ADICA|nr:hypothetical protein GOP47_0021465 [Adiantum capillus-veneris]
MASQSWWTTLVNWLKGLLWKQDMDVCLVGRHGAGKTSLVNTLVHGPYSFSEDMIPTVGFNMKAFTKGKFRVRLWDVGGQARFRSMWERYCRGVSVIVFVVDAADLYAIHAATLELHSLLVCKSLQGIPLLVLGNKNDLPGALSQQELTSVMELSSLSKREVYCYSISCKNHSNIDVVIQFFLNHPKFIIQ